MSRIRECLFGEDSWNGTRLLTFVLLLGAPEVIERVLAVVNGHPVLLSEVRTLATLRGLSEDKARDALIDERLMFDQASRVPQAAVSSAEEDTAYHHLLERRPELATLVPEAESRRVVRREAAILKYVEFRFSPQVRVTDDDLRRVYAQEYGGQPEAPPFDVVAEALRERAVRRELDRKIEAWVQELRAAAEIRIVSP